MVEIYWGSGSPYSWRALLALELKRIPYESHVLQFSKREHQTPEYRAISPRGKVPALRDGDYTVYESLAILAYLDRKYPEPPLFGRTAEEAGRIFRLVSEYGSYIDPDVEAITDALYFGRIEGTGENVRAASEAVAAELARYEESLAASPWLAGDAISAADLVFFPAVMSLQRAGSKPAAAEIGLAYMPYRDKYPRLVAWQARIEALPGYDRTYPPHWRPDT